MNGFLSIIAKIFSGLPTRLANWFIVKDYSFLLPGQTMGIAVRPPQINWAISLFRIITFIVVPIIGIIVVMSIRFRKARKKAKMLAENASAVLPDEDETIPATQND
ncbi:MAG: hypothetical protein FWC55_06785 [Firmicutes bacterium]|nr:hypothetical protein [Bacillota bacterium]